MGKSTFELAMLLMKWIPLWLVDKILLFFAWFILGDMNKYGLRWPKIGPLELKNKHGKTPVLDIGALAKIRSGEINVVPGITRFYSSGVELVNGEKMEVDSVIMATGYRSNVPSWLQVRIPILCVCFPLFLGVILKNKMLIMSLIEMYSGRRILQQKWISKHAVSEWVEGEIRAVCSWVHKERALWGFI